MTLRVGGNVSYRKSGESMRTAIIEWMKDDGTMRVRDLSSNRRRVITMRDVARVHKKKDDA